MKLAMASFLTFKFESSDKSHLKGWSHQPSYRKYIHYLFCGFEVFLTSCTFIKLYIFDKRASYAESLFDIHEDVLARLHSWSVVAWMQIIDEDLTLHLTEDIPVIPRKMCSFSMSPTLVHGLNTPTTHVSSMTHHLLS
jgi:hypothetical protein